MPIERDWITAAGLRAICLLNELHGHRCGYVRIAPWHRYARATMGDPRLDSLDVHGGVTYSGCICPCEPDGVMLRLLSRIRIRGLFSWWIGFDCGHAGDAPEPLSEYGQMMRRFARAGFAIRGHVWTLDEVVRECESLAQQLKEVRA